MIGRTVGKYRIVGQIGRGGTGIVYKAVDESLGREVAVKMLYPDLAGTEIMARFCTEATTLARLNHPQITTILELFHSDAELVMVMELLRGETLENVCERVGPIAPEHAAYVADLILSALEHAHRAGVVHRDIKPANVVVTEVGSLKVTDFGIAHVRGVKQTLVGWLLGTPAYMAPEQALTQPIDGRADLYSVGILLYRMLTGTVPFTADSALSVLQQQIRDEPTPLANHRSDLPPWCGPVVERALMKAREDRFQSAEEFREALARSAGPLVSTDLAKAFAVMLPALCSVPTPNILEQDAPHRDARPHDTIVEAAPAVSPGATGPYHVRWTWVRSLAAVCVLAAATALVVFRGRAGEPLSKTVVDTRPPNAQSVAGPPSTASSVALAAASPVVPPAAASPVAPPAHVAERVGDKAVVPAPLAPVRAKPRTEPVRAVADSEMPVVSRPAPPSTPQLLTAAAVSPGAPPSAIVAERVRDTAVAPAPSVVEADVMFDGRVLIGTKNPKEQDAKLVMSGGKITVRPADDPASALYALPYDRLESISFSHSKDPLWLSPQGPVAIVRSGGSLIRLGIRAKRNWISLRMSTDDEFIVMRFDNEMEQQVRAALEKRTGQKVEIVGESKDDR